MNPNLKAHLESIGPRATRDVTIDAEMAGWNAAVSINDYSHWCVEGYGVNLNIYGRPYLTEEDNNKELTVQIIELYEHVVAINGLRTVRFQKPSLKDILQKSEFPVGSFAHDVYVHNFYEQLSNTHHHRMDESSTETMLQKLPANIEVLTFQAPNGTRTGVSSDGFIGEGQDLTPSRVRPLGQRGAGRVERPHKSYSYTFSMVERVSKQIVHLVTHQDRYRFDVADAGGYIPDWIFGEGITDEERLHAAWDGWENQDWFAQETNR